MKCFLIALCTIVLANCFTQKKAPGNQPFLREIKDKTLIPEGIAVHPSTGKVYISSLHQNKIVLLNDDGSITDVISNGQGGFAWGLGMSFRLMEIYFGHVLPMARVAQHCTPLTTSPTKS